MLAKIAATVDLRRTPRVRHRRRLTAEPPTGPPGVRGARPAVPRLRPRRGEPRRGVHGDPAVVDRHRAVRLRRHLRPAHRSVLQPPSRSNGPTDVARRVADELSPRGPGEHAIVDRRSGDMTCRSALLDRYCAEIGRDPPRSPARSTCRSPTTSPAARRDAIGQAVDAGFGHIVLGLPSPYPDERRRWVPTSSSPRRSEAATRSVTDRASAQAQGLLDLVEDRRRPRVEVVPGEPQRIPARAHESVLLAAVARGSARRRRATPTPSTSTATFCVRERQVDPPRPERGDPVPTRRCRRPAEDAPAAARRRSRPGPRRPRAAGPPRTTRAGRGCGSRRGRRSGTGRGAAARGRGSPIRRRAPPPSPARSAARR